MKIDVCYTDCGLPGVKLYTPADGYVHMCRYTFDRLSALEEHECDQQEREEAETARDDAEHDLDQVKDKVEEVTAALQEYVDAADTDLRKSRNAILVAIGSLGKIGG